MGKEQVLEACTRSKEETLEILARGKMLWLIGEEESRVGERLRRAREAKSVCKLFEILVRKTSKEEFELAQALAFVEESTAEDERDPRRMCEGCGH